KPNEAVALSDQQLLVRPVDVVPRRSAGRGVGLRAASRPAGRDSCVTALPTRFSPPVAGSETSAPRRLPAPGLVSRQDSAAHLCSVQRGDRVLRLLVRAHFHEREPARTARHLIAHHRHRFDGSRAREQLLELRFSRFVREVSDIQLPTHELTPLSQTRPDQWICELTIEAHQPSRIAYQRMSPMTVPVATNDGRLVAKYGYTISSSPAASAAIGPVSCRTRTGRTRRRPE